MHISQKLVPVSNQGLQGVQILDEILPGIWELKRTFYAESKAELIKFLLNDIKFHKNVVEDAFPLWRHFYESADEMRECA